MPSINSLFIQGYVTREVELRYIANGTALASFAVVHNRNFQRNGEWQKESTFVDCKCWGNVAEKAASDLAKGRHVVIAGQLRQESWQAQDGSQRSKLLIVADRVDLVSPPQAKTPARDARPQADDADLPF